MFNEPKIYDLETLIKKEKKTFDKNIASKMKIVDSLIIKYFHSFGKYHIRLFQFDTNININAFWEFVQTHKQNRTCL